MKFPDFLREYPCP